MLPSGSSVGIGSVAGTVLQPRGGFAPWLNRDACMGLFGKRISDSQWLEVVLPSYRAARPCIAQFDQAVSDDAWEEQITAIERMTSSLPPLQGLLSATPGPTSSEARRARKFLESGLRDYIKATIEGEKVIRTLASGLAARTQWGGVTGGMASRRANQLAASFKVSAMAASHKLHLAAQFLERFPLEEST